MPFPIKPWQCVALCMFLIIGFALYIKNTSHQPITFEEYTKKSRALEAEEETLMKEINALNDAFYATLSPSDRAAIREGLSEEARQWWPTLFDDITPAQPPDPTISARCKKALLKLDQLIEKWEKLPPMPAPTFSH